jgi:hypothetical protein
MVSERQFVATLKSWTGPAQHTVLYNVSGRWISPNLSKPYVTDATRLDYSS